MQHWSVQTAKARFSEFHLLDTNVVSELRKPKPHGAVVQWLNERSDSQLHTRLMHRASDTLYEHAMIAATAKLHKFIVVTRNVADFKGFGVQVLNPFLSTRRRK